MAYYFGEKEEQAVIDYNNSDSIDEKNRIYNQYLKEPFRIMTESILRRYATHIGNYSMSELEINALEHLIENMYKYDPNTVNKTGVKTKAYSYCQTIVRNYYIDHSKRSSKEKNKLLSFDDCVDEIYNDSEYIYSMESENIDLIELISVYVSKLEEFIDDENNNLKHNEIITGDAIVNILNNWDILFLEKNNDGFSKKVTNKYIKNKVLFLLKEQTRLSSKDIRLSLKPFKELYFIEKMKFID